MNATRAARQTSILVLAMLAISASGCQIFEPKAPGERIYRRECAS